MRVYGFPLILVLAINISLLGQDAPETQPPPSTEAAPEAAAPPGNVIVEILVDVRVNGIVA